MNTICYSCAGNRGDVYYHPCSRPSRAFRFACCKTPGSKITGWPSNMPLSARCTDQPIDSVWVGLDRRGPTSARENQAARAATSQGRSARIIIEHRRAQDPRSPGQFDCQNSQSVSMELMEHLYHPSDRQGPAQRRYSRNLQKHADSQLWKRSNRYPHRRRTSSDRFQCYEPYPGVARLASADGTRRPGSCQCPLTS